MNDTMQVLGIRFFRTVESSNRPSDLPRTNHDHRDILRKIIHHDKGVMLTHVLDSFPNHHVGKYSSGTHLTTFDRGTGLLEKVGTMKL